MPSPLLVVFLLQLIIHLINTFGASAIIELVLPRPVPFYTANSLTPHSYGRCITTYRHPPQTPRGNLHASKEKSYA